MEEPYAFRRVAFGGFSRQDVAQYLASAAQDAAQTQEALQKENDRLQAQVQQLTAQLQKVSHQVEVLSAQRNHFEHAFQQSEAARQALSPLTSQVQQLSHELDNLRPDAAAYAQFREQIGAIECEARKRAADLEDEVSARLEEAAAGFRQQYNTLRASFDTTAAHATNELHKIEVQLVQIPRTMDQIEKELEQLETALHNPPVPTA